MKNNLLYLFVILCSIIGMYCDIKSVSLVEMSDFSRHSFNLLFLVVFGGTIVWATLGLMKKIEGVF